MNWYATRHDGYNPPIVRGMRRQKTASRARVLDDQEIRQVWGAAESSGTFGAIIRMCLPDRATQRKVVGMRWSDISESVSGRCRRNRARRTPAARWCCPDSTRDRAGATAARQATPRLRRTRRRADRWFQRRQGGARRHAADGHADVDRVTICEDRRGR